MISEGKIKENGGNYLENVGKSVLPFALGAVLVGVFNRICGGLLEKSCEMGEIVLVSPENHA